MTVVFRIYIIVLFTPTITLHPHSHPIVLISSAALQLLLSAHSLSLYLDILLLLALGLSLPLALTVGVDVGLDDEVCISLKWTNSPCGVALCCALDDNFNVLPCAVLLSIGASVVVSLSCGGRHEEENTSRGRLFCYIILNIHYCRHYITSAYSNTMKWSTNEFCIFFLFYTIIYVG